MTRMDYKQSLENAKIELAALQKELGECLRSQEELEKKIVAIRQMIVAFSNALGQDFDEGDALGLTDALRQAFKTSNMRLAATDVRLRLESLGYDITRYGNMMAAIHTVISRLVDQGQIRQNGTNNSNKPVYEWISSADTIREALYKHAAAVVSGADFGEVPKPPKR
jgi:cysteinyl-tRNA synthetase